MASLSKKLRFEVFKRDKFTCQYCGRAAPDVLLHADHIKPRAEGGEDEITNLVTACQDCNLGKGARSLSDDTAVKKSKRQLDELQERREQIEMMMEWHGALKDLDAQVLHEMADYWAELVPPYSLTEAGLKELARWRRKYEAGEIMESMRISVDQYVEADRNGNPDKDSVNKAWNYVGRIASVRQSEKDKPYLKQLFRIRAIVRNHFPWLQKYQLGEVLTLLEAAHLSGVPLEELESIAKSANKHSALIERLESYQ